MWEYSRNSNTGKANSEGNSEEIRKKDLFLLGFRRKFEMYDYFE